MTRGTRRLAAIRRTRGRSSPGTVSHFAGGTGGPKDANAPLIEILDAAERSGAGTPVVGRRVAGARHTGRAVTASSPARPATSSSSN